MRLDISADCDYCGEYVENYPNEAIFDDIYGLT